MFNNQKNNDILNQVNNNVDINTKIEISNQNMNNNIEIKKYYPKGPSHGNIGNNMICCDKYVIGEKSGIFVVVSMTFGECVTIALWIIFNGSYFPWYIYLIGGVLYLITETFYLMAFLTEPGIIPRNHPDYIKKANGEEEINLNENKDINNNINEIKQNPNPNNIAIISIKKDENVNNQIPNYAENININGSKDNQEIKPRIFTERECTTCHIIRPPGASHCSTCNNCVLNFDHHCGFISNCVGKRNHKYFYLFVFFGVISCLYYFVTQLITIIKVYIVSPKGLYKQLWDKNKYLFLLSIITICISLPFVLCLRIVLILLLIAAGGYTLFIIIFYVYYDRDGKPFYYNPFLPAVLFGVFFFMFSLVGACCAQTRNIFRGYTVKQVDSIEKMAQNNKGINNIYFKNISCGDQLKNMWNFLKAEQGKSLIVPERDLFSNKL